MSTLSSLRVSNVWNVRLTSVVSAVGAVALAASLSATMSTPAVAAEPALVQPKVLIVDPSLPKAQAQAQILAARRYDSFWNTGDESLEKAALAPDFTDRTLPAGREQGVAGPLAASKFVRGAVPDLQADIDQMIVSGDRVVTHLHFHGRFTGQFKDIQGKGQTIDFIATDIYRVAGGRIVDNWHLEDNLTFLQQIGVVSK